jgi:effector-binding domain-containing protein
MSNKLYIALNPGLFHIPIKILTPRLAKNKQNSIFYTFKSIAEVKFLNYEYVLTTAGEYEINGSNKIKVKTLTDAKMLRLKRLRV